MNVRDFDIAASRSESSSIRLAHAGGCGDPARARRLPPCRSRRARRTRTGRRRGDRTAAADGRVDLAALLALLAQRGVNELHVEAGAALNGALLAPGW